MQFKTLIGILLYKVSEGFWGKLLFFLNAPTHRRDTCECF